MPFRPVPRSGTRARAPASPGVPGARAQSSPGTPGLRAPPIPGLCAPPGTPGLRAPSPGMRRSNSTVRNSSSALRVTSPAITSPHIRSLRVPSESPMQTPTTRHDYTQALQQPFQLPVNFQMPATTPTLGAVPFQPMRPGVW